MSSSNLTNLAIQFKETGSEKAFNSLYKQLYNRLYSYVYKIVKNKHATKDILSDCFTKVYTKIDTYNPNYQITTWIYTIAYHDALSYCKKQKRKVDIDKFYEKGMEVTSDGNSDYQIGNDYDVTEAAFDKTENDYLEEDRVLNKKYRTALESIDELGDLYKDIIYDRLINEMSYKDIMFKHDDQIRDKYNNLISNNADPEADESYKKTYKRSLQRVKNRIRRGKMLIADKVREVEKAESAAE